MASNVKAPSYHGKCVNSVENGLFKGIEFILYLCYKQVNYINFVTSLERIHGVGLS